MANNDNNNKNNINIYSPIDKVILEAAMQEMLLRINLLRRHEIALGLTDPVEHVKGRIKSEKSMVEKLIRKNYPVNAESAFSMVKDAVGIRIVCMFVDDVYRLVDVLKNQGDLNVVKEKDYIKNPKANGYRSYHIIVKLPVHLVNEVRLVFVEIQIRTIAMDTWASLEHQLKYKHNIKNQELIVDELKRCASELASTDLSMQMIQQMIEAEE
ncbi:MAG: GTP pyrophosphokinase family protein [Lachnospiraceae bacterium]|nr:GTP pyrophosphokinase family protein [Lachnospiraceae bacterium]